LCSSMLLFRTISSASFGFFKFDITAKTNE
jgi:hypothetical protein